MPKILLIDDDKELLEIISAMFLEKGYTVFTLTNGEKADRFVIQKTPDCVILDVMMPGKNGFQVCKDIRAVSSVPVIFLTGRVSEADKVSGLFLGADDYIEKPFSLLELEARVHVAIRRTQKTTPDKLLFPPLEIDMEERRVLCNDMDLQFTPREFDIFHYLATAKKDVFTYEDIGKKVWGVYQDDNRQSVMVIISRMRRKLDGHPVTARMIETVWSVGYRFVPGN